MIAVIGVYCGLCAGNNSAYPTKLSIYPKETARSILKEDMDILFRMAKKSYPSTYTYESKEDLAGHFSKLYWQANRTINHIGFYRFAATVITFLKDGRVSLYPPKNLSSNFDILIERGQEINNPANNIQIERIKKMKTVTSQYERTVQLAAALPAGSTFVAQTHNGSITVTGADVADCNLTATIITRARTEKDAKKLNENIEIKFQPHGNTLAVKIEEPNLVTDESISVNFDARIPSHSNLEMSTSNGALKIIDINGKVDGKTNNGGIITEHTSGDSNLQTDNGPIICKEISGNIQLKAHNGNVEVKYFKTAPSVCDMSIVTYNGSIDLAVPSNLSAEVDVSTYNGSINTELPTIVTGKMNKMKLAGKIGTGQGKLYIRTYNGLITIK
ncbi:MAG TPA: DUF4097 family beta strand repeat-containing protein [Sedimentisphaerales bacterium]|nr:DUF4097 family beta strand repeat-containing protein [Sedimentisphaerales bacterium]